MLLLLLLPMHTIAKLYVVDAARETNRSFRFPSPVVLVYRIETRNADKPRDAFVQMQWRGLPSKTHICYYPISLVVLRQRV